MPRLLTERGLSDYGAISAIGKDKSDYGPRLILKITIHLFKYPPNLKRTQVRKVPPMARNLFSVPIFFIVFRETLEAAIIVSVLLGLVEQIVHEDSEGRLSGLTTQVTTSSDEKVGDANQPEGEDHLVRKRRLIRKLRIQVRVFVHG